ncbi:transporter ExbB [Polynucleobacter sp. SHI8]|uniref:MotA/TolQ/ExbB proton channel family protein n=1 Tax=unclassified Polynucleobacter TaxID=2640945 RepID=UPI002491D5B2|nr:MULTISPECIES: MotA/TolQ/ExbB proton channel family protein [unclassified Polynucleobacter]BDW10822.1 transporter ExbB [Polynucleobacter sp. SHI2]BDW13268.1 transporter ExbB [Polynucleobacter sp. SHI8]
MEFTVVNFVLVLLILLSIYTWGVSIWKLWQLRQIKKSTAQFEAGFWEAKDWAAGEAFVQDNNSLNGQLARVGYAEFRAYMEHPEGLKFVGDPGDVLQRAMNRTQESIARRLERGLAELGSIGALAPFIGLFGTVWGIMHALTAISESGKASIDVVAGPIGEALIATAIGIGAAVPAVFFYNYLVRKLKLQSIEMETFVEAFLRLASINAKNK